MTYSEQIIRTVLEPSIRYWYSHQSAMVEWAETYEYPDAPTETIRVRLSHEACSEWRMRTLNESGRVTLNVTIAPDVVERMADVMDWPTFPSVPRFTRASIEAFRNTER